MILKMWVKVTENVWVKVREKLPAQAVDRSRKITHSAYFSSFSKIGKNHSFSEIFNTCASWLIS